MCLTRLCPGESLRKRDMLKLKEGFVLQEVAGENVVLPSGDELDLSEYI